MINVPEVAYQEDEICEQYESSIDDENVNLCGDVGERDVVEVIETEVDGMARGKGRGTIAGVRRGGRIMVENDGRSACSRLRKGRSLSQNDGSFNDEIEETPIESNTTQTQRTKSKQLRKSPDGRIYVEPYDNSFHPHQAVCEIGKIIQKQFGGSWIVWNEVPQEVKDLWFSEFKRLFIWEEKFNAATKKNFVQCGRRTVKNLIYYANKAYNDKGFKLK
ncbi:uncharacterized protein G2W53_004161 [Senna tora]|uniref:Uncharacterized protein n=1 Tax=Senna tora TaxID=362788 RepID=A0A834XCF2_9FABA|nr:uncharacterized protein G2W53_004161 [Senna tora]